MKRLTTPEEMDLVRRLYPTGNHFISLPVIAGPDGSVDRVGLLHMGTASLIEFGGPQAELGAETLPALAPLLRPFVRLNGRKLPVGEGGGPLTWRRLQHWVPVFEWPLGELVAGAREGTGPILRGTIFAPLWRGAERVESHKGFVYVLEFVPGPAGADDLWLGLDLHWGDLIQTVYTSRRLPAQFTVRRDRWTGGPVLEPRSGAGAGPGALAVAFSPSAGGAPDDGARWSADTSPDGHVRLEMAIRSGVVAFYFGGNREGDGARTVAIDLSRHGWRKLLAETGEALAGMARPLPGRPARLEERLNLNLLFNHFFATGRTIDTEELVLITSRSPLYYVSAAFWARDALLWSFPGLLLTDPVLAEEAIGVAFDRYFHHAGSHSLYMDGRLLYPGFELDELAAYPIALRRYVEATGDRDILARRNLLPKLRRLFGLLAHEKHPEPGLHLYRTFLLPSDDPASHPYVTYDNVMVWRACRDFADLLEWGGQAEDAAARRGEAAVHREEAALVRDSIYKHLVIAGPKGPMFVWSSDLAGGSEVADEPPGSLELLAYYGFCPQDDEVWRNTLDWILSRDNPYRYSDGPFPGLGCPHAKHPFVMGLFNALLGGRPERVREAEGVLLRAPLDTGLACEAFDRQTGEVKTGAAFATCAGFLGYAMDRVFGGKVENR